MTQEQLSFFVELAYVDGLIRDSELNMIRKIGLAGGMSLHDIEDVIRNPKKQTPCCPLANLSEEEKFEFLYKIVLLMKIDGKFYRKEIEYCIKVAEHLGYSASVLFEFIHSVISDPYLKTDKEHVWSVVQKHKKEIVF